MAKYNKSFFGVSAIIVSVAMYIFVIVVVFVFFYAFKYQITLVIYDVYTWNKIQEMPLSLLSIDTDKQSFIINANKAYKNELDRENFQENAREFISDQLFYFTGSENRPFGYTIWIFDMKIDEEPPAMRDSDCACDVDRPGMGNEIVYECNSDCTVNKEGEYCGWWTEISPGFQDQRDDSKCFNVVEKYEKTYPIPLTFNGTDFVAEIKYKVVEYNG